MCSRAEWIHLWEHQQLHLYCERLFPVDWGEKRLFKTLFGTCSLFTRFLTVINHRQHSPGFQAWCLLLKTTQRNVSCLRLVVQTLEEGNSARKQRGSPRNSLLNCLIELCCLGEGPSLRLSGMNYALQAVSGDETWDHLASSWHCESSGARWAMIGKARAQRSSIHHPGGRTGKRVPRRQLVFVCVPEGS